MIVDINKYIINKKFIQEWFLENGEEMGLSVSIMANSTMVPCVVCAFWIGEAAGWPTEMKSKIERLVKFYGYTEIIGVPDTCPYVF